MGLMEIVLIIIGIVAFAAGFFLPGGRRRDEESAVRIDEEDIRSVVEKEMEEARSQLGDIVDETITYAMEKTERSMDRLTNEKMLAVNEYSDTVLGEINKSHKEVVFLYDMLNDKHESLKATVSEAIKADSEIKQVSRDTEITAREMQEKVQALEESVNEAISSSRMLTGNAAPTESGARSDTVPEQVPDEDGFTPMTARTVDMVEPEKDIVVAGEPKEKPKASSRKRSASGKTGQMVEITFPEAEVVSGGEAPFMSAEADTDKTEEEEGKNNNDRILQLHKAGKSNMAIARELGLGLGEVKLVIDLFEGA